MEIVLSPEQDLYFLVQNPLGRSTHERACSCRGINNSSRNLCHCFLPHHTSLHMLTHADNSEIKNKDPIWCFKDKGSWGQPPCLVHQGCTSESTEPGWQPESCSGSPALHLFQHMLLTCAVYHIFPRIFFHSFSCSLSTVCCAASHTPLHVVAFPLSLIFGICLFSKTPDFCNPYS